MSEKEPSSSEKKEKKSTPIDYKGLLIKGSLITAVSAAVITVLSYSYQGYQAVKEVETVSAEVSKKIIDRMIKEGKITNKEEVQDMQRIEGGKIEVESNYEATMEPGENFLVAGWDKFLEDIDDVETIYNEEDFKRNTTTASDSVE